MSISNSKDPILYIVDEMPLTRAQLSQFLSGFARLHGMRIEEISASGSDDIFPQSPGGMCVINAGASVPDEVWFSIVQKLCQTVRVGPVVLFCEIASADFVRGALHAGARGVVPASTTAAVALKSLDLTLHGGIFVPPSVLDALEYADPSSAPDGTPRGDSERLPDLPDGSSDGSSARGLREVRAPLRNTTGGGSVLDRGAPELEELTPRQMAVLDHLGKARSNKEIARVLDTTEATVKLHVRQVMRKLGAKNRTEAALIAARCARNDPQPSKAPAAALSEARPKNAPANVRERPESASEALVAAARPQVFGSGPGGSVAERLRRLERSSAFQHPGTGRLS